MQKSIAAVLLVLFLSSCGGGADTPAQDNPAPPPSPPGPTALELLEEELDGLAIDDFYEASFRALLLREPETVIALGLEGFYGVDDLGLDDLSDPYADETRQMYELVLQVLATFDRDALDDDGRISYDIYDWFLRDGIEAFGFRSFGYPGTYSMFGVPGSTQRLFTDTHPLETPEDAERYVARLRLVQAKFRQLSAWLLQQRADGVVEPAITMRVAEAQVAALAADPGTHPYYTRFRDSLPGIPGLSGADRDRLRTAALNATTERVVPAYQELLQTLRTLLPSAPPSIGVSQFSGGREYYRFRLRHHTTTDLTPAEVHQMGLDELSRIHFEMRLVFDQLGYPQDETLEQLFARVATDGGVIPAADTLSTFEGLIDFAEQNLDQAFELLPSAPVIVIPDPFGGFYIGPSFDGSRPGAFYAGTGRDLPYYDMPTLTFHEAVPGHHLQIGIAQDLDLPTFRRIVRSTAFVEGWALYAERLAYELGWYDSDLFGNLGRLQFEAMRAARLVMDTGIHDLGWSFDEATQFSIDNVGWPLGQSQGAVGRYSVFTAQATAYMVGMLKFLELRQRAMDALGTDFDLREYHRVVLGTGGMPLSVLDTVVDRYIAAKLAP